MNREYIGSTGETEVSVNRSMGRIYLRDTEGFEQHITTGFLAHGWHRITALLVEYYGVSRHRLIEQGLPIYYKRRVNQLQVFERRAQAIQMFKHRI